MAIIPRSFMEAVVALGVMLQNGKMGWIGTGFLVGRREKDNPDQSTVYVVTNKHVVRNQQTLFVRFNIHGSVGVKDLPMTLKTNDGSKGYSEHPLHDVDVAAIQINPNIVIGSKSNLSFFDLETNSITLAEMESTGVEEGSLVYALGFPMNLVDESVKAPICRLGCISRVMDAFVNPGQASAFLVDAQTFPGNSGGPIISRPEYISIEGTQNNTKANLIGILSAYIPYKESLYSSQTNHIRMVQEENSGLTIVHPVDRIKEVVELEWERIDGIRAKMMSEGKIDNQMAPQ